jgi:hypothetical protein
MAISCFACEQEFSEYRALATHVRFCIHKKNWETELDLKCKDRRHDSRANVDPVTTKRSKADDAMVCDDIPGGSPLISVHEAIPGPEALTSTSVSHSGHTRRAPQALRDFLPHSLIGLASHLHPVVPAPQSPVQSVRNPSPDPIDVPEQPPETIITTEPNLFGLYREYTTRPRQDPENCEMPGDSIGPPEPVSLVPTITTTQEIHRDAEPKFYDPFPNPTIYRLLDWFFRGSSTKNIADLDRLVKDVLLSPDFNTDHLLGFRSSKEITRVDTHDTPHLSFSAADGWREASVTINVPHTKHTHTSESAAPEFEVHGVHYRPLLEIIKSICQGTRTRNFHWVPHKLFHRTTRGDVRVYSDIYNSDAMLEEHARVSALPCDPSDDPEIETAIMAILLWSDLTHLANFGTASLWPIYMFSGNISKYVRGKPTAFPAHHVAYIPSVSID